MSMKKYFTGYVLSIAITVVAFGLVQMHLSSGHLFPAHDMLVPFLAILALCQLLVQAVFFLHLGKETSSWNWFVLGFALMITTFVVGGSFWIMGNLQHGQDQSPFMDGHITAQASLDD